MTIRTPAGVAIAGLVVLALGACQDDATGPTALDAGSALLAKGGNGGGKGGGPPDEGGPPDKKGDLYADLVFVLRDADGLPLLKSYDAEEETVLCVQPVSYTEIPDLDTEVPVTVEQITNPVNGLDVWLVPLYGDYMPEPPPEMEEGAVMAAPPDGEEEVSLAPCDPYGELDEAGNLILTYGIYASEVGFGRLNLGRAPQRTVDRAYDEVLLKLSGASLLLMDHAGRWAPDDVAIDAPAEDLVIHRELVTKGQFAGYTSPVPYGWDSQGYTFLDHAASMLAGAADKFGVINEDLVVYNNRVLGFPEAVAEGGMEVITGDGVHGFPGEKYLDYGDFSYTRSEMFPGCVIYGVWEPDEPEPSRVESTIMDAIFGGADWSGVNLNGFAIRADDARAVILFEHDFWIWEIDRIGETAVCEANEIE